MTAREAHQAQWKALQDKPLSDKLKYIVTYYWPAILGVICVIAIAVSWIGSALSQKGAFLSGYMINGTNNPSYTGNLKQEFMDRYLCILNKAAAEMIIGNFVLCGNLPNARPRLSCFGRLLF